MEGEFGHIEKMRIPDDDVLGWIKTLREGGFSDEQIDTIISGLNETYAKAKGTSSVEDELRKLEDYLREKYNRYFTPRQRKCFRKSIEERPEFKKDE